MQEHCNRCGAEDQELERIEVNPCEWEDLCWACEVALPESTMRGRERRALERVCEEAKRGVLRGEGG